MPGLIIYGVPFSQPVRAVLWLLMLKKIPFELVLTNPGSSGPGGSRHPDFLTKNPGGTIPCLEEPETGFTLGEAHAIMTYLSEKNAWHDVYPSDLQARARIDGFLHFHHRNFREASVGLVAPKVRKDLNIPESVQMSAHRSLSAALKMLETSVLSHTQFLTSDTMTLADLAAYVEIGQLQPEFTNVFDFSGYPNVQRWMNDMKSVDGHDDVHVALTELGDISEQAPDMDQIKQANRRALGAIKARLEGL
ncbi:MAG: glutathione S-transferase family protein [Pseudomonadales bacterium]